MTSTPGQKKPATSQFVRAEVTLARGGAILEPTLQFSGKIYRRLLPGRDRDAVTEVRAGVLLGRDGAAASAAAEECE